MDDQSKSDLEGRLSFIFSIALTALIVASGLAYTLYRLLKAPTAGGSEDQKIMNAFVAIAITIFTAYVSQSIVNIRSIKREVNALRREAGNTWKEFQYIKEATLYDSIVVTDAPEQSVWRGFIGEFQAFNPSFGSDASKNMVEDERWLMHFERYLQGVTKSKYYFFKGGLTVSCDEVRLMNRFIQLIETAQRLGNERFDTSLDIRSKIFVTLVAGQRNNKSFYIGKKKDIAGRPKDVGIIYETNDETDIFSNGLIPALLIVSSMPDVLVRIKTARAKMLDNSEMEEMTFDQFKDYVHRLHQPNGNTNNLI